MEKFRDRYWNYENFKSMYYKTRRYTFGKTFVYDENKPSQIINKTNIELNGGELIETIISKYSNIVNIQIDKTSSDEIELMVVNINGQITCGIIVLDKIKKIATIQDLLSDISCLKRKTSKSVMEKIISIIKKICKQMGMENIVLTDTSVHTCNSTQTSFKLNLANTLTSGEPYYYRHGFRYVEEENDSIVRSNREIISGMRTFNVQLDEILTMVRYVLKKMKKNNEYINKSIRLVEELYNKNLSSPISKFFNDLKYSSCELFAFIYKDFAVMLNLGFFTANKLMYFKL
jgi:hypothetical protein